MDNNSEVSDINEGFIPIFVTKITLKLKKENGEENEKAPHEIVFKIFVKQDNDVLNTVRFQLSDDKRLDFLYESDYDLDAFEAIKHEQNLEIEFDDFPNVIRQLITTIIKQGKDELDEGDYKVSFKDHVTNEDGDIEVEHDEEEGSLKVRYLIISQRLEFCSVEIFRLTFVECDNDKTERISQYRYDEIAQKLKEVQTEFKDTFKRIQRQDPKILRGYQLPTDNGDQYKSTLTL